MQVCSFYQSLLQNIPLVFFAHILAREFVNAVLYKGKFRRYLEKVRFYWSKCLCMVTIFSIISSTWHIKIHFVFTEIILKTEKANYIKISGCDVFMTFVSKKWLTLKYKRYSLDMLQALNLIFLINSF